MLDRYSDDERKIPELSVLYRVRRRLKSQGKNLRRCAEGSAQSGDLGRYFVVDAATKSIVEKKVDLEALARELGAMRPSESMIRTD